MKNTKYTAYLPDENGYINYSNPEHQVWNILYNRQIELIKNRAYSEYLDGLERLHINANHIPQPVEISKHLYTLTGWTVEPVPALINFKTFFKLLSERKFPAASFIRTMEDLDYLQEPDIFHEIFGHCPLLTNPDFAQFSEKVGHLGVSLPKEYHAILARLYWFTVEFGLINTQDGVRIYGAGILSSKTESIYALEDPVPVRKQFDLLEVLSTTYRYDTLQSTYYIIDSFKQLYDILNDQTAEILTIVKKLHTQNINLTKDAPNDIVVGC